MPDSVSSDGVPTVRATLARAGRTDRPKVSLPDDARDRFPTGEVVHLLLGGADRHAKIERAIDDALEIRGVYDNVRMARESDGENRLSGWADDARLDFGRSVLVDVLDEGFAYGLRAPGEETVYRVPDRPDEGLASIAEETSAGGRTASDDVAAGGETAADGAADE